MKFLFNLSFRYKIPLWGSLLIVTATLAVSAALMAQAYDDLRIDLESSSASLGRTLSKTLFSAMIQQEVWQAFAIIRAPLHEKPGDNPFQPEMILALDQQQRVFVSSHPKAVPMLTDLHQLGDEFASLAQRIAASPDPDAPIVTYSGAQRIYVGVPVAEEGARLGTLVVINSKDVFLPRFRAIAWRSALIGLLVLAVLLPINWYWGQRTVVPLVHLARGIGAVAHRVPPELPLETYAYRDELGQLFEAYGLMVKALQERVLLEQEVIRSERLAMAGKLSAGVAHEINNPLGGMLVALANFKRRYGDDERAQKTVAILERGLTQIRETVSAMLVDAKVKGRNLAPHDLEDVRLLLTGEALHETVAIDIECSLTEPVALPATQVRQILMNLLLNAIHASPSSTKVSCRVYCADGQLRIETSNAGKAINADLMDHLFEPFASDKDEGHGLGLWVTYQIVTQLGGQIAAASQDGLTQFRVTLPIGESHA
ncbi:sensor histidine kinase [Sulfuritalea sp.]|uniref:sensor histidine kinase n=1 Tax=Sulfuritalea sp. TaxID=2480090 RepID=UPI00286DEDAE|nr:ATP-binding protein [Sulfuritalea sp.]